jgi:molybdopterin-guanine dinucleotide biosynthesis protein A
MSQLVGVVLAGGEGRRMGRSKGGIPIEDGVSLAERAALALGPLCATVIISVSPGSENPAPGYSAVEDREPAGRGPLAALDAAFDATGNADLLVLACDYPRVDTALLETVLNSSAPDDEMVIVTDRRGRDHPLVGLWRRSMATPVRAAVELGLLKVRSLLAEARVRRLGPSELAAHDPDAALVNVNTRSELESL